MTGTHFAATGSNRVRSESFSTSESLSGETWSGDSVVRELLLRKLADLELYATQAGEFRGVSVEEYRRDWKTRRIVERTLQMAIEVCADIANHIIADRRLRVPATYAEAFEILGEVGILTTAQREAMVRMSGFRNIIVHEYARTDPAMVVHVLRERLGDFAAFKATIFRILSPGPFEPPDA